MSMNLFRKSVPAFAAVMCLGDWASSAMATAYTWNTTGAAATTYTWSTAANWSPARVPLNTDTAYLNAAGTYTVTLTGTFSVNGLVIGGGQRNGRHGKVLVGLERAIAGLTAVPGDDDCRDHMAGRMRASR